MIVTWERIQVLALLVCGLATAPFGSLEQFDAASERNATLPCLTPTSAASLPLHAASWRTDVPVRSPALHMEWSITVPQPAWQHTEAYLPAVPACTLTYYATAPPSHLT